MKHLDDGRLQSWLDRDRSGITEAEVIEIEDHVASCRICAARLAELEESSDRTRSLLAVAAPAGDGSPDFDDVVRRSRRGGLSGGRERWWIAAGWAASLVVAVGLGWMSNEILGPRFAAEGPGAAEQAESMVAAREVAQGEEERGRAPATGAADAEAVAVAPATEPEPEVAAQAPTPPAQARAEAPPPATVDPDPGVVAAPAADVAEAPSESAGEPGPLRVAGRVTAEEGNPIMGAHVSIPGTELATVSGSDGTFSLLVPRDSLGADPARPLSLTARSLGFQSSTLALDPGTADTVSVDFRLEGRAVALDAVVVSPLRLAPRFADVAPELWVPTTREQAESMAAFALLTVPDLPILEIEMGRMEGTPAVRVRQALESGAVLTLVQRRADGPGAAPTLPEGQPVVTVRRGDVSVTGSAPIPVDSLRALLEALKP
jgi:hypothetical protein